MSELRTPCYIVQLSQLVDVVNVLNQSITTKNNDEITFMISSCCMPRTQVQDTIYSCHTPADSCGTDYYMVHVVIHLYLTRRVAINNPNYIFALDITGAPCAL